MNAQHTPGRIAAQCVDLEQAYLVANVGGKERAIARVMIGTPEGPHNLRRLAACWNACEGLTTEALERLGTLDRARVDLNVIRAQAIAQRDELLAELQRIADAKPSTWDPETRDQFQQWAQNRARHTIAKVTGGTA